MSKADFPFSIKAFHREDAAALADLHRRSILTIPNDIYTLEQLESWSEGLTSEGYLDAIADGESIEVAINTQRRVVGFCSRKPREIKGLYVDPDFQGKGIGAHLLAQAEAVLVANDMRISRIVASLAAKPFYMRYGYIETGQTNHKSRGGIILHVAVMEKNMT